MAKKHENYLDYVPAISEKNSWEVKADGLVTIHMVHRGVYLIAEKAFHRPRVSHIDLDAMGSFIFQRIDGIRTVGQLAQLVKEEGRAWRSLCTTGWQSICRSCGTTASSTMSERTGYRNEHRTDHPRCFDVRRRDGAALRLGPAQFFWISGQIWSGA